jgi:flagellar motility protein MotE (MotC chaperone)
MPRNPKTKRLSAPLITGLAAGLLLAASSATAKPDERTEAAGDGGAASEAPEAPAAPTAEPPSIVEKYCTNIRDSAAEARIAWQMEELRKLEQEVEQRIADLDARQTEFEEWLRRREDFVERAKQNLVAIYANMRPDAAAQQLAILEDEEAASVLSNLVPRTASAILNEMNPERAAQLALAMAGPPQEPKEKASQ